jgi:hypothetical protein
MKRGTLRFASKYVRRFIKPSSRGLVAAIGYSCATTWRSTASTLRGHSAYEYTENVIARVFTSKWSPLLRLQVESPSDHFPLKS